MYSTCNIPRKKVKISRIFWLDWREEWPTLYVALKHLHILGQEVQLSSLQATSSSSYEGQWRKYFVALTGNALLCSHRLRPLLQGSLWRSLRMPNNTMYMPQIITIFEYYFGYFVNEVSQLAFTFYGNENWQLEERSAGSV